MGRLKGWELDRDAALLTDPRGFPARGRLRQAGASGVRGLVPRGRLGGRHGASLSVIPLAI